jgi:hypothetical protein
MSTDQTSSEKLFRQVAGNVSCSKGIKILEDPRNGQMLIHNTIQDRRRPGTIKMLSMDKKADVSIVQ